MAAEDNPDLLIAEQAFHASRRVERVRRQTKAAQRSAADSFDKSADSHDRTARSYEKLAALTAGGTENLERAARHREFAEEDRGIAERLRRMADGG